MCFHPSRKHKNHVEKIEMFNLQAHAPLCYNGIFPTLTYRCMRLYAVSYGTYGGWYVNSLPENSEDESQPRTVYVGYIADLQHYVELTNVTR